MVQYEGGGDVAHGGGMVADTLAGGRPEAPRVVPEALADDVRLRGDCVRGALELVVQPTPKKYNDPVH